MIELRELKSSDIFPMVQILNKIGFRELKTILTPEKVKDMMSLMNAEEEQEGTDPSTVLGFNMMIEVVGIVMNNLPSCEDDLYKFLSNLSGLSPKQISNLPMSEFADMVISVIKKQEFTDFFKAVSRLFN